MTGEKLRAIRKRLGLNQGELAARLGIRLNTVSRYEIGQLPIPAPIEMLARLLAQQARKRPRRRR